MERKINRSQQGDLGEASAIEWLTRMGAVVLMPVGHSPDFDLVAYANGRLLRIQVKTSTQQLSTPQGVIGVQSLSKRAAGTKAGMGMEND